MWHVRKSDEKGYGLFAADNISCSRIILEEEPITSCQFSWNKLYKYFACDYCMKSLETSEEMARRLTQNKAIVLPHPECCPTNPATHVNCPNCEVKYCCSECRLKAYNEHHKVLCPALHNCDSQQLDNLEEIWRSFHYPPETATVMLLLRIIARVKLEPNKDEFRQTIESFCHESTNESENIAHKLLGSKYKGQLEVLRKHIKSIIYDDSLSFWFTDDGFVSLFALLGTNQQGIGSSALSIWAKKCDSLNLPQDERQNLDQLIDNLYEEMDNVSGEFLNCEGAGLYMMQSKCNHSCVPNAEVCFLHNNHRLTVKAIKDIHHDEEITISYLNECELSRSRHSRQKYLRENYLFTCKCEKCYNEADDPDETSDEDLSSDSDEMQ